MKAFENEYLIPKQILSIFTEVRVKSKEQIHSVILRPVTYPLQLHVLPTNKRSLNQTTIRVFTRTNIYDSLVTKQCLTLYDPVEHAGSIQFSRQEYWSGLPFPPPGDFPDLGIKPMSPALAGGFFITGATQEAQHT